MSPLQHFIIGFVIVLIILYFLFQNSPLYNTL